MSKLCKDVAGAILAGGKSARMGFPKLFLTVKGKKIIDRTIEMFDSLFGEILIVTDDRSRFIRLHRVARPERIEVVEDLVRGCGPVGGIYTGLKLSSKKEVFFVAYDMPFLHIGLIRRLLDVRKRRLLDVKKRETFDCIIPYTERGIEPLHGIYSKKMLKGLEDSLTEKKLSVSEALARFNCKYIKAKKEETSSFVNLNTPQDLKEIMR